MLEKLNEDERDAHCQDIVARLDWQGPVFRISAINGLGTRELSYALMEHLEEKQRQAKVNNVDEASTLAVESEK